MRAEQRAKALQLCCLICKAERILCPLRQRLHLAPCTLPASRCRKWVMVALVTADGLKIVIILVYLEVLISIQIKKIDNVCFISKTVRDTVNSQ